MKNYELSVTIPTHVKVPLTPVDLITKLCETFGLNVHAVVNDIRDIDYRIVENTLYRYEDISYHGSSCWQLTDRTNLTDKEVKLYSIMKELLSVMREEE